MREQRHLPRLALGAAAIGLVAAVSITLLADQPTPEKGDSLTGEVVGITDGDRFSLLVHQTPIKIRLEGIDAPEIGQAHGTNARRALSTQVLGKVVRLEVTGKDKFGRTLGWLYLDGENINEWLLANGWAWQLKENQDERLAKLESDAREAKLGLWERDNALPPWEYRARQKKAAPAAKPPKPDLANIPLPKLELPELPRPVMAKEYWLNTKTNVRHNPSCENFNNTKEGRPCTANEGKPCGKCGG